MLLDSSHARLIIRTVHILASKRKVPCLRVGFLGFSLIKVDRPFLLNRSYSVSKRDSALMVAAIYSKDDDTTHTELTCVQSEKHMEVLKG